MKLETSLLEGMALLIAAEYSWIERLYARPRSVCGSDTAQDVRCSDLCTPHGRRLTQILIDIGANGEGQNLLSFLAGVGLDDESEWAEGMRDAAAARLCELFPHLEAERVAALQAARASQGSLAKAPSTGVEGAVRAFEDLVRGGVGEGDPAKVR